MSGIERALAVWPGIELDEEAFGSFLGALDGEVGTTDEGLAELVLACACQAGDAAALNHFEQSYLCDVAPALAHMKLGADAVDEVKQLVRQKLLLPDETGTLRLSRYAGQGKLSGLIRVTATREAISLLRKNKDVPGEVEDAEAPDVELGYLRAAYRAPFKAAFETAIRSLSSRERNVLRLHHLGGMTVEQVGAVYGVHRATVTRWLASIRGTVLDHTRKAMQEAVGARSDELDSVMAAIQSQVDMSVERVLRTESPPEQASDE